MGTYYIRYQLRSGEIRLTLPFVEHEEVDRWRRLLLRGPEGNPGRSDSRLRPG